MPASLIAESFMLCRANTQYVCMDVVGQGGVFKHTRRSEPGMIGCWGIRGKWLVVLSEETLHALIVTCVTPLFSH